MALSKDDLSKRLLSLIEDLEKEGGRIEGLAVADAARAGNAVIGAYNALRSLFEAEAPKVVEVSDPGFDLVAENTKAVADGKEPNVHPASGETVPPGSTEGVRPAGKVSAPEASGPVSDVTDGADNPAKAKPKAS